MTIPRVDLLIKDSRIASLQKDYGEEYGIQDDFFLVALNKANQNIQRYLVTEMAEPFAAYQDIDLVAGQVAYDVPSDIFATNLIYDVRVSLTGLERDLYEPLEKMTYRQYGQTGNPCAYLVDGNIIYLDSAPQSSTGFIRVRYERRLNKLDIRRGTIDSVSTSATQLVALSVDVSNDDEDALSAAEYITLVTTYGGVIVRNVQVTGYDTTTGNFTFPSAHTYTGDDTLATNAQYVCIGNSSSTHFQLPDCFEDYYIDFIKNEVYELLSEEEQQVTNPKLDRILAKCAEIYAQMPSGHNPIPEIRRYY